MIFDILLSVLRSPLTSLRLTAALLSPASHLAANLVFFHHAHRALTMLFVRPPTQAALLATEATLLAGIQDTVATFSVPVQIPRFVTAGPAVAEMAAVEGRVVKPGSEPSLETQLPGLKGDEVVHRIRTIRVGDPTKPPMLLVHGHSMTAAYFLYNFQDLAAMGYCVYALDLPGWGLTDSPGFHGHSIKETLYEYVAAFEAWRRKLKLGKMVVVAHSMGGYFATQYAHAYPEAVRRLILVSPAGAIPRLDFWNGVVFAITPAVFVRSLGLLSYIIFSMKYPQHPQFDRRDLFNYSFQLFSWKPISGDVAFGKGIGFKSLFECENRAPLTETVRGYMSRLGAPPPFSVNILAGETDDLVNTDDLRALLKEMDLAEYNASMLIVKGAGHCMHIEMPEVFHEIIREIVRDDHVAKLEDANSTASPSSPTTVASNDHECLSACAKRLSI